MARILDYNGNDVDRTVTVATISGLKEAGRQLAQVTAATEDEAAAAEDAGIEMVVCIADAVPTVRKGSSRVFLTAAIDFGGAVTEDDILRAAFDALSSGADAVISARGLRSIERLAHEDIPVMGHLGFIPKKSTIYGGVRAVGKKADEAAVLWKQFQQLEDAGAFAVECELIPANVLAEINQRTAMATISLGSGSCADVAFLFTSDICGEGRVPRHARQYADLNLLHEQVRAERIRALTTFRSDVESGAFPGSTEVVLAADDELARFIEGLGNQRSR